MCICLFEEIGVYLQNQIGTYNYETNKKQSFLPRLQTKQNAFRERKERIELHQIQCR